jgi:hypothetical protein
MVLYHVTKTVAVEADDEEQALAKVDEHQGEDVERDVKRVWNGRGENEAGCPRCGRDDMISVTVSAIGNVDIGLNGGHVDELEWGALEDVDMGEASGFQCGHCGYDASVDSDNDLYAALNLAQ